MNNQLTRYLIVPGWQGSGADHWQSYWEQLLPNTQRVEQDDWLYPDRQNWTARLDQYIKSSSAPVVLIGHSLGCVTIACWANQASPSSRKQVRGALLVAPADVERPNCPGALRGFAPIPLTALPFPSLLVGSDNDRAASADRAIAMGQAWGSEMVLLSGCGHINAAAGFHHWEAGFAYLYRLQGTIEQSARKHG
ncbi:MAG: alpha/beta hydrolase [Gammaproteobacteria bacterium HGW-Gammaproteobacteria-11]|nr:MAG: alpha/beta hydrolase [Gammaproteobacteria bacterium HGW-Gammaproteobacteria-11]